MKSLLLIIFLMTLGISAWAQNIKLDLSQLSTDVQVKITKEFPDLAKTGAKYEVLDQLIQFLVVAEQFDSAQILQEQQGNTIIYRVLVGKIRRISKMSFSGMNEISESEIRKEFSVSEKSVFDQQTLIDAGERVRRLYRDRGFQNTTIDLEFERQSATDIAVKIQIKEGPQTRIVDVDLRSQNPRLQSMLEKFLVNRLEKEALTDSLLNQVRNEARNFLSERSYYKTFIEGPSISLNADESEARLVFTVVNPDEFFLDFKGLKQKTSRSIQSKLELEKFFSSNPQIGPELSNRIKNLYLEDGFARVEVSHEQVEGSLPFQKKLIFNVNEGPKVKISEIRFDGRFSQPEQTYAKFITEHSAPLIEKGYYNRDFFENGIKNLIIDRQNNGYLKAKVVSTKVSYQGENRDRISITVNLDEGPLTELVKITFTDSKAFSEAELLSVIDLQTQSPLRLNQLDQALVRLRQHYRNSGYLEMSISNEKEDLVIYNEDNTKAELRFRFYEGPQVKVGSIVVEGNSITKDYVILKEVEFEAGDILTPEKIDESIARLQRLGHFSSIDIRMLEEKTQLAERTIVVRVQDRFPGLANVGFGANNERQLTLRGYTGVAYRNILGSGRGVSLRLEGNYNIADIQYLERRVIVGYIEPYLFNSRVKGRVTYTQSDFVSDSDKLEATEVKQITYAVEQDITSNILVSFDLWNSAFVRKFAFRPNEKPFDTTETAIVTIGPTIDLNYTDHPFNPTSGTRTIFNMEYASPPLGSSERIEYTRYFASFTQYLPLGNRWVWANSLRGGSLRNLSTKDGGGVPYDSKGFSLGGQSSNRGFTIGEVYPAETELGAKPTDYKLKGTANMYLIKSELRFPIYNSVGGALFYDGGAVFIENLGFEDPYRDAAGIALRYETPVGAVSLDFGYKLDRKDNPEGGKRREDPWAIHFSIGTF